MDILTMLLFPFCRKGRIDSFLERLFHNRKAI